MAERIGEHKLPLKDIVENSTYQILEQNNRLGLAVIAELASEERSVDEVLAALDLMERLAAVARGLLEGRADVIFNDDRVSNPQIARQAETQNDGGSDELRDKNVSAGPKTFGELLDERISAYLGEGETVSVTKLRKLFGANPIYECADDLGYSADENFFKLGEAKQITRTLLTRPYGSIILDDNFDKKRLLQAFFQGKGGSARLKSYSDEIDFDWETNTLVDQNTALEIRGLSLLDRKLKKPRK